MTFYYILFKQIIILKSKIPKISILTFAPEKPSPKPDANEM